VQAANRLQVADGGRVVGRPSPFFGLPEKSPGAVKREEIVNEGDGCEAQNNVDEALRRHWTASRGSGACCGSAVTTRLPAFVLSTRGAGIPRLDKRFGAAIIRFSVAGPFGYFRSVLRALKE